MWRRRNASARAATARRQAVNTGVVLARLQAAIDRLEGVYQQIDRLGGVAQALAADERRNGEGHRA